MSKNIIKERHERTRALQQEAAALDTTKPDGRSRLEAISNEVKDNDEVISAEIRRLELAGLKAPKFSGSEERDLGAFDFGKVVRNLHQRATGGFTEALSGIEAEMATEGAREAREHGIPVSGLVLPRFLVRRNPHLRAERRDMTAGTAGEGGNTIQTDKVGLLDDFYNALVLRTAGARVFEGVIGNLDLPRILAGTAGAAKAENAAADETSPTTAMLSLSPNRLPAYVEVSERLLAQSSANIQLAVQSVLFSQALATAERAFFHGTGTNEAEGICTTSGVDVTSVVGGTNGAAPTLANIVGLETAVDTTNALIGNLHYFSNGKVRGKLKTTPKVASTDSRMLLEDSSTALLNGYSPLFTNAIRSNLTKGDQSLSSAIVFGNAQDYAMAFWGGLSLEVIRDSANAKVGQYHLQATLWYDGGVTRPKSWAAMLDALTA
jgi:HK97 family phage major capsid protein